MRGTSPAHPHVSVPQFPFTPELRLGLSHCTHFEGREKTGFWKARFQAAAARNREGPLVREEMR